MRPIPRLDRRLFEKIISQGRLIRTPTVSLKVLRTAPQSPSAFGFAIGKKGLKRAVDRNLLKRRARHVLRQNYQELPRGWQGVFFLKPELRTMPFSRFQDSLLAAWRQLAK